MVDFMRGLLRAFVSFVLRLFAFLRGLVSFVLKLWNCFVVSC